MDIVERLRRYRPTYGWPEERSVIVEPTLNHVASDEIEQLRQRDELLEGYLNGALNLVENFSHCDTTDARKALEGWIKDRKLDKST